MPQSPKFYGPDGILRSNFTYTTTVLNKFIRGYVPEDSVDIQVSIRGGGFISDPKYITFSGNDFVVPNPSSHPDGIDLVNGENRIEVRSVNNLGRVSSSCVVNIILVNEKDVGKVYPPPTGVTLERYEEKVKISAIGVNDENFVGMNFYCSTSPSGGLSGYNRINLNTVIDYRTERSESSIASMPVYIPVILGPDGEHLSEPQFLNLVGNQLDRDNNVIHNNFDEKMVIPKNVKNIKLDVSIKSISDVVYYSFIHDRLGDVSDSTPTIPISEFRSIKISDPLYYVVSAVYFDKKTGIEFESVFSPEVVGSPIKLSTSGGVLPQVSREMILDNLAGSINRNQPDFSLQPGSVLRDVLIDPMSFELQRIRFLTDFIHRAQTFSDLIAIDYQGDRTDSIPVSSSQYKQALKQSLYLTRDSDVQEIINQAFEKLAGKYGVFRSKGTRSVGEVTFYTVRRPENSKIIPAGTIVSGGQFRFRTTMNTELNINSISSFYDSSTGRYSVKSSIEATEAGSSWNVPKGRIKLIVSGPSGLLVTNENDTFGGIDFETNRQLAVRAQNALSSVDVGTEQGYFKTAISTPGVRSVKIVGPGDDLMYRDVVSGENWGGKVDIWVGESNLNKTSDSFAFSFKIVKNMQFELVSDEEIIFMSADKDLSPNNPIIEMLNYYGYGLRNATSGEYFNLTNYEVISYNTIKLSAAFPQPPVSMMDVILGDYRYRSSNTFDLSMQPVREITSLIGEVSGSIDPSLYYLNDPEDPLKNGRSTKSMASLVVLSDSGIPSGTPMSVSSESHVLLAENIDYLYKLGINQFTVDVWNQSRTTKYNNPFTINPDYTFIYDKVGSIGIRRTGTSSIASGESVLVDYLHDENFVVNYKYNFITSEVQNRINKMKHITSDVLVKEAYTNNVDITATVVLKRNNTPQIIDGLIRSKILNYVSGLNMGGPLRVSDIIWLIEGVQGVSYVSVPLTKMIRSEGSIIIKENLSPTTDRDFVKIDYWSDGTRSVYLLDSEFDNQSIDGGAPVGKFKSVYKNGSTVRTVDFSPQTMGPNSAYIIGNNGYPIDYYSDDKTLINQGYDTPSKRDERRKELTSNRIVISVPVDENPSASAWGVTYTTSAGQGVKNIETGAIEMLSVGNLVLTYDEDYV